MPANVMVPVLAVQATMDWEAQDEGVIAKILAPDGSKDIPVGTVVAVVVEDAEHVRPFVTPLHCRVLSLAFKLGADASRGLMLTHSKAQGCSPRHQ